MHTITHIRVESRANGGKKLVPRELFKYDVVGGARGNESGELLIKAFSNLHEKMDANERKHTAKNIKFKLHNF